jgi:hypothetical protein
MAITANTLIYDILEIASSGGNSNEFKISKEQILYWIEQTRSLLISQSLNKHDDINDSWIQYIPCLQMELVDASECCSAPSGCMVLKSTKQLPSTIDSWKDNWIVSVSTIDGSMISKSNPFKSKYQQYNKYTGKTKSWYVKNDYLYIINDEFLELVEVAALFETPSDLKRFADCGGNSCFNNDSNYPVSLTLATQITDIIIKTKINPFMQSQMDNSNDASGQTQKDKGENKQVN